MRLSTCVTAIACAAALVGCGVPAPRAATTVVVRPHAVKVLDKGVAQTCVTTGRKYRIRTCQTIPYISYRYNDGSTRQIVSSRADASRCQRGEYLPCS